MKRLVYLSVLLAACSQPPQLESPNARIPSSLTPYPSLPESPEQEDRWTLSQYEIGTSKRNWSKEQKGNPGQPIVFAEVTVFWLGRTTLALNNKTGAEVWTRPGRTIGCQLDDGVVYLRAPNETHAVEVKSGKVLWTLPLEASMAVVWQNLVSLLTEDQRVVTFERKNRVKKWELSARSICSDDKLLYCSQEKAVLALDAEGKEIWRRNDLAPFGLLGCVQGVLLCLSDPEPSVGGLPAPTTSQAIRCQDGKTLYQKPKGFCWTDYVHEKTACAVLRNDREDYEVVEPVNGRLLWKFSGAWEQLDTEGPYLLRKKRNEKLEALDFKTGRTLLRLPVRPGVATHLLLDRTGPYLYVVEEI